MVLAQPSDDIKFRRNRLGAAITVPLNQFHFITERFHNHEQLKALLNFLFI